MLILSQDGETIVNLDHIASIKVEQTAVVAYSNDWTSATELGAYRNAPCIRSHR